MEIFCSGVLSKDELKLAFEHEKTKDLISECFF